LEEQQMKNQTKFKYGKILALLTAGMLVITACQAAVTPTQLPVTHLPSATALPTATTEMASFDEPTLMTATDPVLGQILVDGNGMTLYMYTVDEPNQPNCAGDCLEKWPPLLTHGDPQLGDGIDAALVGTATLADGDQIVTYNKMPLYHWFKDTKAGETNGQGVGSVWYVVSPDGAMVDMMSEETSQSSSSANTFVEPTIQVSTDSQLGSILVDGNGMTLYLFTKDEPNKSNCDTDCLAKWPPLLTQGNPEAGDGVDASLLGSADLGDGNMIVTYNQMPLYYWIKDKKPGDTTGEDVGGVWYVVSPDGEKVEPASETSDATEPMEFDEPTIMLATDSTLGQFLVDGNGMTLYLFTKDEPGKSNCSADCLAKWPPLLTQGNPVAGEGVDAGLLGTVELADGTFIVTYNSSPLYYWVNDKESGDISGQGVGEVWYVVSPDGSPIVQ